jgi:hypothetical protein
MAATRHPSLDERIKAESRLKGIAHRRILYCGVAFVAFMLVGALLW